MIRTKTFVATGIAIGVLAWADPHATLAARRGREDPRPVLDRVAGYVGALEHEATALVADEEGQQDFKSGPWLVAHDNGLGVISHLGGSISRHVRAELLVLANPTLGAATYRDIYEVDGQRLHDGGGRLAALFAVPTPDAARRAAAIVAETAQYDLNVTGVSVAGSANGPVAALFFLRRANQPRSRFSVSGTEPVNGRAATLLEFKERGTPRLVQTPNNAAMEGTAWVEPDSGRVLRTELTFVVETGKDKVAVRIRVAYAANAGLTAWMPASMEETYVGTHDGDRAGTIVRRSSYTGFRPISNQPR